MPSFQAYLDAVEAKTGKTPNDLVAEAQARGLTKSRDVVAWLRDDYGLTLGYARAIDYVIQHGAEFTVHRKAGGPRVETGRLVLDGGVSRAEPAGQRDANPSA